MDDLTPEEVEARLAQLDVDRSHPFFAQLRDLDRMDECYAGASSTRSTRSAPAVATPTTRCRQIKELTALSEALFLVGAVRGDLEARPFLGGGLGDFP